MSQSTIRDREGELPISEDDVFRFLSRVYVQGADDRQKAMGLQYMEAETYDLAKEIHRLFGAQIERDQAELARLRARLKPYEDYQNYVRRMMGDPRVGVHIPPADWGLPQNAAASAPQQAEPKLRESVMSESAMERAKALAVSVPGGPGYDNRLLAVFATAITEAEQAARASAINDIADRFKNLPAISAAIRELI